MNLPTSSRRRTWRRIAAGAAALALTSTLAACGDDESGGGSGDSAPLKVAIGSNALAYAAFWAAEANDLFEEHGVEVDVVNANALAVAPTMLTSGEVDVLLSSAAQSVAVAGSGKEVSNVFALFDYAIEGARIVGAEGVTSIEQVQEMGDDCTLVTTQRGTSTYAFARQVVRAYDLDCTISEVATNQLSVTNLTSGQATLSAMTVQDAASATAEGANVLVNPSELSAEERARIVPNAFPALTAMGLTDRLEERSGDVEKFLAALAEGLEMARTVDAEELAESFATLPHFPGMKKEDMVGALQAGVVGLPESGLITEEAWGHALASYEADFNLPDFSADDPAFAYDKMVATRYLEAATGAGGAE